jgi:hypothetical protein
MNPDFPNENDDPDTAGKTVPPYEGRRETADIDPKEESTKEGAKTAGATGPVDDDDMKGSEVSERGAQASPADEQPAAESGGSAPDEGSTGPAHQSGTPRGEDMPDKERS